MDRPSPSHKTLTPPKGPVVLCILDGIGLGAGGEDDAIAKAHTPVLDHLLATKPWMSLQAHGTAVGLPTDGDMGNSEVGHNAMGAGRVFDQGAKLVDLALRNGRAFDSDIWEALCAGDTLHLLGLVSDGNVHSHVEHLHLLIDRALQDGVDSLRVHVLTDGRDVSPRSALTWIAPLEAKLAALRADGWDYHIASGGGRMHLTMDRYEADWSMVERGWRCHVHGEGRPVTSASAAIQAFYDEDPEIDDQWLPAFVIVDGAGDPVGQITDGDSVLFFNFRGDRALEISRAFGESDFTGFSQPNRPQVFYAGMMEYDGDLHIPAQYLVAPPNIDQTVGELLASANKRSFACSETHKYGHVTFFFNGNRSGYIDESLETYLEIPSDTARLEERPWMKAAEITDAVVEAIHSRTYNHIRLNLANGDMVGHTGDLRATKMAVEAVDLCLGRLLDAVNQAQGVLLITADHGNADEMFMRKKGKVQRSADGQPTPKTSHTLNQVPFIFCDPSGTRRLRSELTAGLASIGTTLLELCGVLPPVDYVPGLIEEHQG